MLNQSLKTVDNLAKSYCWTRLKRHKAINIQQIHQSSWAALLYCWNLWKFRCNNF